MLENDSTTPLKVVFLILQTIGLLVASKHCQSNTAYL